MFSGHILRSTPTHTYSSQLRRLFWDGSPNLAWLWDCCSSRHKLRLRCNCVRWSERRGDAGIRPSRAVKRFAGVGSEWLFHCHHFSTVEKTAIEQSWTIPATNESCPKLIFLFPGIQIIVQKILQKPNSPRYKIIITRWNHDMFSFKIQCFSTCKKFISSEILKVFHKINI